MSIENKIRLNAFNDDDLEIFSFLCQDAIISKEEIFFDRTKTMFVATLTRYCWEQQKLNEKNINYRVVTGLQIRNVKNVEYNCLSIPEDKSSIESDGRILANELMSLANSPNLIEL